MFGDRRPDLYGRDTIIANRLKMKRRNPDHNSSAMYGHYRNAVRDCTATLVEEFRPSGTVITPRVNCFWRPG